jgi:hypothetical protein
MPGTAAWNIEKDIGTDLASRDVILIRYPPARERKRCTARRATRDAQPRRRVGIHGARLDSSWPPGQDGHFQTKGLASD